jgi:3-dehydroshikimate dehydratase
VTPDPVDMTADEGNSTGRLRAGLCSIAFRSLSVPAVAELAARCGLTGIEWGGDVHVPPGDLDAARVAGGACASVGVACPSYGSYLAAGEPDAGPDAIEPALEVTQALGATNIRVWAGRTGSDGGDAAHRQAVVADLSAWCTAAAACGVTLSVELHADTLTDTTGSTLALLAEVRHLWTYWQPRDGDAGAGDLAELATLAPRLSHVHVFWWRNWLERFALADGEPFWRAALTEAAPRPGRDAWPHDRWAFIEFVAGDDPDQLVADARTLRHRLH